MTLYAISPPNQAVTFVDLLTTPARIGAGAPGEFQFMSLATADQIATVNLGGPTQQLAAKLGAGITIESEGAFPEIDGTYAYDPGTQGDLAGIAASIGLSAIGGGTPAFPDGTTSGYQYPQMGGEALTTFPSVAAFQAFYAAYAKLLQQMRQAGALLAATGSTTWPDQSVTTA